MRITYKTLADLILRKMTKEQQESDLVIYSDGEFYPAELKLSNIDINDSLDDKHPYLAAITNSVIGAREENLNTICKHVGLPYSNM